MIFVKWSKVKWSLPNFSFPVSREQYTLMKVFYEYHFKGSLRSKQSVSVYDGVKNNQ